MAEEKTYPVLLVNRESNAIIGDGLCIYRGNDLPDLDQTITVEVHGPPDTYRARVTEVVPDHEYPIRAVELDA